MKITLAVIVLIAGAVAYILTPPNPLPTGAQSRAYYQPGTLGIIDRSFQVTDESRPVAANNDFEGADSIGDCPFQDCPLFFWRQTL